MYKVAVVSLGCPKNQVDAEMLLYALKSGGLEIVPEEAEADAIIINTCAFIEDAKAEAIENILEAAQYKVNGNCKALIVTGCIAERYRDDVTEEIPEVDVAVGLGKNGDIAKIVIDAIEGKKENYFAKKEMLDINAKRILGSYPFTAYLKIAEGCDNCCTYCCIPEIRGRFRSRTLESVLSEAKELAENGVREIILVAQDTTRYGEDIYGKPMLAHLISKMCKIEGVHWIRTLYTYPDRITDELLEVIGREDKCVKYLDIPLQHCNAEVLRRMNRNGDKESLLALITKIRECVPNITLRTSLIAGFPGETEQQFEELCEFVKEAKFDRLGCFAYSAEEGTPAAAFDNQLDMQLKQDRAETVMNEQLSVMALKNEARIGTVHEVLIEGWDDYIKCYFGRSGADAPEIDAKVFFTSTRPLVIGDFVKVLIDDSIDYDLLGELYNENESAE